MEILITILIIITILFFLVFFRDKSDFFSPRNIIPALYFVKIIPCMFFIAINKEIPGIGSEIINKALSSQEAFIKYGIYQLLAFIILMVVIVTSCNSQPRKTITASKEQPVDPEFISSKYKRWGAIFYVVGLVATILNVNAMGGLSFYLNNLSIRTTLLRDQDILTWISSFIYFGPILYIYSYKFSKTKTSIGIFMWAFVLVTGVIHGMGGRKSILMLLITVFLIYHYVVKEINIKTFLNFKTAIFIITVGILFVLIPMLRTPNYFTYFISNTGEVLKSSIERILMLFVNESYVPYYISSVFYFNITNIWFGTSFFGLLTAFIPSTLYNMKSPVDDGMYLYSIMKGRTDIAPVMPVSELDVSSYPLETFGSMNANFGFIGIIVGMLILGFIISYAYKYMRNKQFNLFSMLLYVNILINFELSTLRITQLIMFVISAAVVVGFAEKINPRFANELKKPY